MLSFLLFAFLLYAIYTGLLAWGWHRARTGETKPTAPDDAPAPPLSVVVAIRNEADRLPGLLEALDAQTHPGLEVVLVDDGSTDRTGTMLADWANERADATVVTISPDDARGKKHALSQGIAAAQHDLFAFTDADCTPPPTWAEQMARRHAATESDTVLVGYSPMRGRGLLASVARYETLLTGLLTAAACGWNRPYMAVGRNVSYPKRVFEATGGFAENALLSGDDDLFVQAVRRKGTAQVEAVLAPETHVPTSAPDSWTAWLRGKHRHASAGRAYAWEPAVHLTLLHGSTALLWAAPGLLGTTGLGLLATALLLRHAVVAPSTSVLGGDDLLAAFPVWELGVLLYTVVLAPLGLLWVPEKW